MTTRPDPLSEQQLLRWRLQRHEQDKYAEQAAATPAPSAEWSDVGRDLEHWPHNWYVRAALGVLLLALSAGGWWLIFKWLELGSSFLR